MPCNIPKHKLFSAFLCDLCDSALKSRIRGSISVFGLNLEAVLKIRKEEIKPQMDVNERR
jgi:hypothetical protein